MQIIGGTNAREAFEVAQQDARHIWGNSGRSGTIAEAKDYAIQPGGPMQEWDAILAARALSERDRLEAGTITLIPLAEPGRRRSISSRVTVTGLSDFERDVRISEALAKVCKRDEGVYAISEIRDWNADGSAPKGKRKFRVAPQPKLPALASDKITNFHVTSNGERVATFRSATDARRWAKEYLRTEPGPLDIAIRGEIARRDGGPLFTMGRIIAEETIVVKSVVATAKDAPTSRWIAIGIYPWMNSNG